MKGQINFDPGHSSEYKDLVRSLLMQNADQRLPLIRVFNHPWVLKFQKKYNITREPSPHNSEQENSSEYESETDSQDDLQEYNQKNSHRDMFDKSYQQPSAIIPP